MSDNENLNSGVQFTEDEFKVLSLFEGEDRVTVMKELLNTKLKLTQIPLDAANESSKIQTDATNFRIDKTSTMVDNVVTSLASFFKEIILSVMYGADKIPAVIDSYSKFKQMEFEMSSENKQPEVNLEK